MPLLAACASLALSACATGRPPITGEPGPVLADEAAERAYREVLARYTDQHSIYDGVDTRLFAAATYQSPAFVEARVRRMGEFQAQPPELVEAALAKERGALEGIYAFVLGVHANDPRHDDFDRPESIWRLALIAGGHETAPASVRRLGRSDLNLRAIYPHLGQFWVAYEVRFSGEEHGASTVPEGAERMTLLVASTLGKAELHFPVR
ncbi:MAG: hypothetical protein HYZ28_08500 [Myxococcales bacterium]|nr:hypothetical protein [Myxococcales bacterium]